MVFRTFMLRGVYVFKWRSCWLFMNPFYATGIFFYFLKTTENPWFTDVFKGYIGRDERHEIAIEILKIFKMIGL